MSDVFVNPLLSVEERDTKKMTQGLIFVEKEDYIVQGGIKINIVPFNAPRVSVIIDSVGFVYTDEETANKVSRLFQNLFEYSSRELAQWRDGVWGRRENIVTDRFGTREAKKAMAQVLSSDIYTSFEEASEMRGTNRERIIKDSIDAVLEFTKDKMNPSYETVVKNLLTNRQIIFLKDEDYKTLLNAWGTRNRGQAVALARGMLAINHEAFVEKVKKEVGRYKLVRYKEGDKRKYLPSIEQAVDLIANYLPYHYGIPNTPPIEKNAGDISDEGVIEELYSHLLWTTIFHEVLHVATPDTKLLEGLYESATYYYTLLGALQKRGLNAFGADAILTDLQKAFGWVYFMKEFDIDETTAQMIFYNSDENWTAEKIFSLIPSEKFEDFYYLLDTGIPPYFRENTP